MSPDIAKKIAAFTAAAVIAATGGAARTYSADNSGEYAAAYNNKTRELVIRAETAQPSAHVTVSVASYESGTTFSADNIPLFLYVYDTDEKGVLSETIKLASSYRSGKYYVCADYGKKLLQTFMLLNENDPATISAVDAVNQCRTEDELCEILRNKENQYIFGADLLLSESITESMAEYCLNMREKEDNKIFTPESFSSVLAKSIVIAQISQSDETEQILTDNAELFGTTPEEIGKIPEKHKKILLKLMKNADYADSEPTAVFSEKLLTSQAAAAESMSELRSIIENNAEIFGTDISADSDYASIKNGKQISVFGYMLESNESFTCYADVKKSFYSAVTKVKNDTGSNSGSKGSGSGSGGRKTSVVMPPQNDVSSNNGNKMDLFSDIGEAYAKEYIEKLCNKKVLNGFPDGTFRPDESVTRAEFSKMLCILLSLSGSSADFSDVKTQDWFYPYVAACAQNGIAKGFDGCFMPQEKITREDCAVMVCRAMGITEDSTETEFADNESISGYARGAVKALSAKNIIMGDNGLFRPKDNLKRGDAAIILCRLSEALN